MFDRPLLPGTLLLCMSCLATGIVAREYQSCNSTKCKFRMSDTSIIYFHSLLLEEDPKLIKFNIVFYNKSQLINVTNATRDTFQPTQWFWTYNSSRGMYPYLYWDVDFGVLSFGLLEVKTLREHPFVHMDVISNSSDCVVTLGTRDTTKAITCALEELLKNFTSQKYHTKYQNSYFCFLAEKPGVRNSFGYTAAMYFLYPLEFINYKCCVVYYNYTRRAFVNNCLPKQIQKWPECAILPFVLGLIFLLYSPIIVLTIGDNWSRSIKVIPQTYEMIDVGSENSHSINATDDEWIYLDGSSPYTILDWISQLLWCGLDKSHPVAISRIKRLLFLLLSTIPVLLQLLLYYCYREDNLVDALVRHGCPMGFRSLLAEKPARDSYFVPKFGGGLNILLAFGILGLLIIVMPSNLKQILEDSVPMHSNAVSSPLCLGMWEMRDLAMIQTNSIPGYKRCSEICISGIILLFSPRFWSRVLRTQYNRLRSFLDTFCFERKTLYVFILIIIIPFYFLFCAIEACLCLIWYGLPFIRCMFFLPKGLLSSLWRMTDNSVCIPNRFKLFIKNPVVFGLISITLFTISSFFTYTWYLIFIQSFTFFSQVLVFCFVAVIVYPAIAFGSLFFAFALLYYIFHMIRGFGDVYLVLLSEAIEISRNLDGITNYTTINNDTLEVSNIRAYRIDRILIEGRELSFSPRNFFQTIAAGGVNRPKTKLRNNVYGIPKKLFFALMDKHKPVNIQMLKILFQLLLITTLLAIAARITAGFVTGPTSEISDVMHVIFIVAIGALPKVLEVAVTTANESVKREIELRSMEQTIIRYWQWEAI